MALYPLIRPLVFLLDAERAHRLTIGALKSAPLGRRSPPRLPIRVAGLDFPNPVGLAAGFDKDAEVFDRLPGFGFTEIGTVTPLAQPGNPKPRLFRLAADRAVINRMGFNNQGQAAAKGRLEQRDRTRGIVGVNIGANKANAAGDAAVADYVAGIETMAPVADYLTVNVSSPNTPGLRGLQDRGTLDALLAAVIAARDATAERPPVFLKVAPDLEPADIAAIARIAIDRQADALIVSNTTIGRPPLHSRHAREAGGLSGAPLAPLALERLRDFRRATGGALPLIAAGGIGSAEDAWQRIRAGASLVQLYTALVYEGPGLAGRIAEGLAERCEQEGFASLGQAVGSE